MELHELKDSIENVLYTIFLNSEVTEWVEDDRKSYIFRYTYKNMTFTVRNPEKEKKLNMIIHSNDENAQSSNSYNSYGDVFNLKHELKWTWFSSIRRKKTYKKFKSILKYHDDKKEYDKLKKAFDHMPLKLQRKYKLDKIEN